MAGTDRNIIIIIFASLLLIGISELFDLTSLFNSSGAFSPTIEYTLGSPITVDVDTIVGAVAVVGGMLLIFQFMKMKGD